MMRLIDVALGIGAAAAVVLGSIAFVVSRGSDGESASAAAQRQFDLILAAKYGEACDELYEVPNAAECPAVLASALNNGAVTITDARAIESRDVQFRFPDGSERSVTAVDLAITARSAAGEIEQTLTVREIRVAGRWRLFFD